MAGITYMPESSGPKEHNERRRAESQTPGCQTKFMHPHATEECGTAKSVL